MTQSKRVPRSSRKVSKSANTRWSEEELRQSVDTYVLLLRLQIQGMDARSEPIAQAMLMRPLALRNDASIRYRMRNISAVIREFGVPILIAFSPAESVGSSVRAQIRSILMKNRGFTGLLSPTARAPHQDRKDALRALKSLSNRIADLEQAFSWIGHNNPPETIESELVHRELFQQALADIDAIEVELEKQRPDITRVEPSKARLVGFAAKIARWAGERVTKFTDAALVAAAPFVVVKVFGLLPVIVDAMEAVARALSH